VIRTITFDLWNTLFQNKSYSKSRIEFLCYFLAKKEELIDIEVIKKCYDHIFLFHDIKKYDDNEDFKTLYLHIYNDERIDKVLNCLDIGLSNSEKNEILKTMEAEMLKDPPLLKEGVIDTLKDLNPKYNLGLISNTGITPGKIIIKVMEKYDILKYFQTTIFSDEIGYNKPSVILFQKALKNLKSKPEECIHIGDLLHTDVKGAKDCGMLSIWFNDINQKRKLDIIPDFEVNNMREIIKIINNLQ
jgi:putative hydrolase of the HAD superfamily